MIIAAFDKATRQPPPTIFDFVDSQPTFVVGCLQTTKLKQCVGQPVSLFQEGIGRCQLCLSLSCQVPRASRFASCSCSNLAGGSKAGLAVFLAGAWTADTIHFSFDERYGMFEGHGMAHICFLLLTIKK